MGEVWGAPPAERGESRKPRRRSLSYQCYSAKKFLLLSDFAEGENLVLAFGLCFLDPTGAIPNAIALHGRGERYGSASNSSRQNSTCVPRFCHKHRSVDLFVLRVAPIYDALSDHQNDSIPIRIRVVGKRTCHQEKPISIVAPVTDIQIPVRNYCHDVGWRHPQRRQVGCLG